MPKTDRSTVKTVAPLLFAKREPAPVAIAIQYAGTETELDIKGPSRRS